MQERLKIAKEFGDRSAERRAHSNLGNAHIFLGEFEKAAEHYKQTLLLAQVPVPYQGISQAWRDYYCKRAILCLSSSKISTPHPPLRPALVYPRRCWGAGGGHTRRGGEGGGSIFW